MEAEAFTLEEIEARIELADKAHSYVSFMRPALETLTAHEDKELFQQQLNTSSQALADLLLESITFLKSHYPDVLRSLEEKKS